MAKSYSVYRTLGDFRDEPFSPGPLRLPAAIKAATGLAENLERWLDPHLTALDAPAQGETVAVWSVFTHSGWIGVARALATAPGAGERGLVHARLWRLDELDAGEDPGVLLGQDSLFDAVAPARGGEEAEAILTRPQFGAAVERNPEAARNLLQALYAGVVGDLPVVMSVDLKRDELPADLPALACFARAALPWGLKRDCHVRIFGSSGSGFLGDLHVRLLVADLRAGRAADGALGDLILLGSGGLLASLGKKPAVEQARRYAEAAVEVCRESAAAVLRFSWKASQLAPAEVEQPAAMGALTQKLRSAALAAESGERADELLAELLADQNPDGAMRALQGADWERFSTESVIGAALATGRTLRGGRLQARAVEELRRRGAKIEALPEGLRGEALDEAGLAQLALLAEAGLVSDEALRLALREVPAGSLLRAGDGAGLLRFGDFGSGAPGADELRLVRERPEAAAFLAQRAVAGELSGGWVRALVEGGDAASLERLAPEVVSRARVSPEWKDLLERLLERAAGEGYGSAELGRSLERIGEWEVDELTAALARQAEVAASAAGRPLGLAARYLARRGEEFPPEERRAWLECAFSRRGFGLEVLFDADGALRCPGSWIGEVAEVIGRLSADGRERVPTGVCIGLFGTFERDRMRREIIAAELDRRSEAQPEELARLLVEAGRWLAWRDASRLPEAGQRGAAEAWRAATAEREDAARLEDWQRFVVDLGRLMEEDVRRLAAASRLGRPFPAVPYFEPEQAADLVKASADVGALAAWVDVFERWPGIDPYCDETTSAYVARLATFSISAAALRALGDRGGAALAVGEAAELFARAGGREPQARRILISALAAAASRSETRLEALEVARRFRLESDPALAGLFGGQRREAPVKAQRESPAGSGSAAWESFRLLAQGLNDEAYRCWGGLGELESDERAVAAALGGLAPFGGGGVVGRDVEAVWDDSPRAIHLGSRLIERALDGVSLEPAWEGFEKALRRHPALLAADGQGRLPGLALAALLRAETTMGAVAMPFLMLGGGDERIGDRVWWDAFVSTARDCPRRNGLPHPQDRWDMLRLLLRLRSRDLPEPGRGLLRQSLEQQSVSGGGALRKGH